MKDYNYPTVSIITVNFNGKRFLTKLFKSINKLDYPSEKMQTIMVDNGSADGSVEFVNSEFPWVRVINLDKNTGYAAGNNTGMKAASGEYFALINNDCTVEKNWLSGLVEIAERNDSLYNNAGAVSSKVLFYYNYLPLIFSADKGEFCMDKINIIPEGDNNAEIACDLLKSIKPLCGCSCINSVKEKDILQWKMGQYCLVAVPIPDIKKETRIDFQITSCESDSTLQVLLKKMTKRISKITSEDTFKIFESGIHNGMNVSIVLKKDLYKHKKDIINSCGIEVNKSFYARDRGANTFDSGQFDDYTESFSPSGSSLLINRKMIEDTGYFDETFFTYYEDLDLFWRARLKGWKTYFAPGSVARHMHCGTGVEWSYSFTYHVLRNRILAIFKSGWTGLFVKSYFSFIFSSFINILLYLFSMIKGRRQQRPDIKARIIIFFELFYRLPKKLISRIKIRSRKNIKVSDSKIKKLLVSF